jgi:formyltetrahydrofolate deformylase
VTHVQRYILTLICPDRHGIVLATAQGIVDVDGNIFDSDQFSDPPTGVFCMRIGFESPKPLDEVCAVLGERLSALAPRFAIRSESQNRRALVMVSKVDHCLTDLLYRWHIGELSLDIPLIVSNHPNCAELAARYAIPFVHLPVTPESRSESEAALLRLVEEHDIDFIVLARYMQILSPELCATMPGRIINIHHSFLPGFEGAEPYRQAYDRGVKLIGATAHYVIADLDKGPIIEQDVTRVTHAKSAKDLVAIGRDVERTVLARAVQLQAEDRTFLAGDRVIIFSR